MQTTFTRKRMLPGKLIQEIQSNAGNLHNNSRFHRKLVLSVTGHFVGTTCAANIKTYMEISSDVKSVFWVGYETQHSRVKKMLG